MVKETELILKFPTKSELNYCDDSDYNDINQDNNIKLELENQYKYYDELEKPLIFNCINDISSVHKCYDILNIDKDIGLLRIHELMFRKIGIYFELARNAFDMKCILQKNKQCKICNQKPKILLMDLDFRKE